MLKPNDATKVKLGLPVRFVAALLLWLMCGCTTQRNGALNSESSSTPPETPQLVIELYHYGDIDLGEDRVGLYVDPGQAILGQPIDQLADSELVGANWSSLTLEYAATVRDRYGESTLVVFPDLAFVLKYEDRVVIVGSLIAEGAAAIMDFPVLEYDPIGDCPNQGLLLHLRPNHGGDEILAFPGLSEATSQDIGDYLKNRPLRCTQGRRRTERRTHLTNACS